MNPPLPPEFAHEYMQLVRRESFLRGLLAGALLTVLVMVAAVLFWPSQARALPSRSWCPQDPGPEARIGVKTATSACQTSAKSYEKDSLRGAPDAASEGVQ